MTVTHHTNGPAQADVTGLWAAFPHAPAADDEAPGREGGGKDSERR